MEGTDISRLVSLIMDNPELVASIKKLASNTEPEGGKKDDVKQDIESADAVSEVFAKTEPTYKHNGGKKRNDLLCAIKPYVSEKRAGAIDTMLSVFDIIELLSVR